MFAKFWPTPPTLLAYKVEKKDFFYINPLWLSSEIKGELRGVVGVKPISLENVALFRTCVREGKVRGKCKKIPTIHGHVQNRLNPPPPWFYGHVEIVEIDWIGWGCRVQATGKGVHEKMFILCFRVLYIIKTQTKKPLLVRPLIYVLQGPSPSPSPLHGHVRKM